MERILKKKLPGGKFPKVKAVHRRIMQGVRGKGNRTTEARFRGALVQSGLSGWRMNVKGVRGTPDFYFAAEKVAVFLDGCFWHGCEECGHIPNKNSSFWRTKIRRNKQRDAWNTSSLRRTGISVIRLWEHEIDKCLADCIDRLRRKLKSRKGKRPAQAE